MKRIIFILLFTLIYSNNVFAKEINFNSFFNNFNMRSITSSMGQQLKYWCGAYPSQFFEVDEKNMEKLTLIRNGDHYWYIFLIADNKVRITNEITSGTYLTSNVYQLEYIDDIDEWWDIDAAKSGKLLINESVDCEKIE